MGASIFLFLSCFSLLAQHAIERQGHVYYEDKSGRQTDLGVGHSPVLTNTGKVAFIRGRHYEYGASFDCKQPQDRNRVVVHDTTTANEQVMFARALSFGWKGMTFCNYDQMQLSPDLKTLYVVSIVNATSGSLAIVRLQDSRVRYVIGVNVVYVIQGGPHAGELIYQQRRPTAEYMGNYPWVHAAADGAPIKVLSDEPFTIRGDPYVDAPRLAGYLYNIGARIVIDGLAFP